MNGIHIDLNNSCNQSKVFCVNCHNHFMSLRPHLKEVIISKHFIKDLKDEDEINSIINNVLDCSESDFTELHKFEEHIDGIPVFRAKKEKLHIVYCIDKKMRIIFLRAFRNFNRYKNFLDNKNTITHMIKRLKSNQ